MAQVPRPRLTVAQQREELPRAVIRIIDAFNAAENDLRALLARTITAGDGLDGGGSLSDDITIDVEADGITDAMLRDSAALSVIGRAANSTGNPADIAAVAASDAVLRESGSVVGFGTVATGGLANDAVTDGKLRNSGALSVLGRSANSSGDPADISTTSSSAAVLRESGGTVGFGTVATAGIANDAVTDGKLRDSAAVSVIGRSANSSGDPADIAASTNGHYLRRAANAVGFGAIDIADLPATVVRGSGSSGRLATWSASDTVSSDADAMFDGSDLTIADRIVTSDPGTTLQTGLQVRVNVAGSKTTPRIMMGPAANVGATFKFLTFRGKNGSGAITLTGAAVGDVVLYVQGMQLGLEGSGLAGQYETTISVANQIQQTSASNLTTLNFLAVLESRSATAAVTERPLYVVP